MIPYNTYMIYKEIKENKTNKMENFTKIQEEKLKKYNNLEERENG